MNHTWISSLVFYGAALKRTCLVNTYLGNGKQLFQFFTRLSPKALSFKKIKGKQTNTMRDTQLPHRAHICVSIIDRWNRRRPTTIYWRYYCLFSLNSTFSLVFPITRLPTWSSSNREKYENCFLKIERNALKQGETKNSSKFVVNSRWPSSWVSNILQIKSSIKN